ncbi:MULTISPECIES: hypothetical protein [Streptomyces]|uniref:hypothetical protein n=1 Tax=Streptomyces TaxID=1883 RepID=UPI000BF09DA3|nr:MULTISPECIES: hypothetical protein [unclassified Streptomyces]WTE24150.1 hypothetical protein OHB50_00410 [Streptomyces anulatus]
MHIAVIGGTGLIGSQVVWDLDAAGHRAVPHSLSTGVDVITGEGMDAVLSWTSDDGTVRLPRTRLQPVAAADVAEVAAGAPLRGTVDLAGPDAYPLDELGLITLRAKGDSRSVTTDDTAGMFAAVNGDVLTPKGDARIAPTRYTDWLAQHA